VRKPYRAWLRGKSELALLVNDGLAPIVSRTEWGGARRRRRYADRGPLRALVLHHTSRRAAHLEGAGLRTEAAYMREVQRLHRGRGWSDIGYHFVIAPSGRIFAGRPTDALGAHAVGHNRGAIGVALAGDFEVEKPTEAALHSLDFLRARLVSGGEVVPLLAHRDLADTECPGRFLYPYVESAGPVGSASTQYPVPST
jgi:hypothetical protein